MKNILIFFCLIGLFATPVFSQKDSSMLNGIIVKINPEFIIGSLARLEGEYGGIIEFPIKTVSKYGNDKKINLLLGGGYNREFDFNGSLNEPRPDGVGYTVYTGLNYYFRKNKNIAIMVSYRRWNINGVIDYSYSSSPTTLDLVINPLDGLFDLPSVGSEESPAPFYQDNATVNVFTTDFVYSIQHHLFKSKRFIIEWYMGAGIRYKTIDYERIGKYVFPSSFNIQDFPFPYSAYYVSFPKPDYFTEITNTTVDLKLGFMIGFIL